MAATDSNANREHGQHAQPAHACHSHTVPLSTPVITQRVRSDGARRAPSNGTCCTGGVAF